MIQQIRRMPIERWLVLATVMLGLLTTGVWAQERWGRPSGTALTIPFAPGRELHLNIWKPGPSYDPGDRDRHDRLIPGRGPTQVAVWYQNTTIVFNRRLALFELPIWPLVVLTSLAFLLLFGSRWLRVGQ